MDWEVFYNSFRKPDFIPGYEIQNRLGGGAFGEVFKARKHSIGKPYAIKFLKIDDDAQREAVERELEHVRHFAAIDHPNLVTIEDMGTVLGVPYLIMGYAGEETLARRLRQGHLERDEALSTFVQISRGVLALHDRRLVHFDLKPGNVFLKGDIARVGDYGLSKLMTSGRLTLSVGRGTPHYMAPEILRSRADHRADIYSLGVMLYECLTAHVPYEAQTPAGLVVRQEDLPPPFPERFPPDMRPVVARCLRLDPTHRYESVEELLVDLRQTARPGDSIRLEPARGATGPGRPTGDVSNGSDPWAVAPDLVRPDSHAGRFATGSTPNLRSGASPWVATHRSPTPFSEPSHGKRVGPPPLPLQRRTTPPPIPVQPSAAAALAIPRTATTADPGRPERSVQRALGRIPARGFSLALGVFRRSARWVARGLGLARGTAGSSRAPFRSRLLHFLTSLALLVAAAWAILLVASFLVHVAR